MNNLNYINDDILNVLNGIILHGVNCRGVMGAGLAKQLRDKYPELYPAYQAFCSRYEPTELPGKNHYFMVTLTPYLVIANGFTQIDYGRPKPGIKYAIPQAIRECLWKIPKDFKGSQTHSIAMPEIGCGLGGLDWNMDVRPIAEEFCNEFPEWSVYVFIGQNKSRESSDSNLEPFIY